MNNLIQRILTGSVYVSLMLLATTKALYIGLLLLLVAIVGTFEFKKIAEKQNIHFDLYPTIALGILTYASILHAELRGLFFLAVLIYFISQLYRPTKNTIQLLGSTFISLVYLYFPLALIIPIGLQSGTYEYKTLFGLLILIWASDSWAYIMGRLLGKRKLFERHSPNKTWEGFWGSFVLTSTTGYVLSINGFGLNSIEWILLGGITVFVATAGDLFQSMLKRASKLKDSGNILPGHGGILDRFDSILFCLPAYYIYFYHISPILNS
jgi:phosphatidate cytidylyltransferase